MKKKVYQTIKCLFKKHPLENSLLSSNNNSVLCIYKRGWKPGGAGICPFKTSKQTRCKCTEVFKSL